MGLQVDVVTMLPVIGESHADPLLGACVRDEDSGAALAIATVAHIPALQTDQFLDATGCIHPRIVVALASLRLLLYCEPGHPKAIPATVMATNLLNPPWGTAWRIAEFPWMETMPVLFVAGEVNARIVFRSIPTHVDVQVPFRPEEMARIPSFPASAMVAADSINNVVAAHLAPMFRAFILLRDIGFRHLAMHSISPCTPDDAQFLREIMHDTRALTRYKVIMLFNASMRAFCEGEGFIFVDRWGDFTEGGLVREGFMADAVHVRPDLMRQSLPLLCEAAARRGAHGVPTPVR